MATLNLVNRNLGAVSVRVKAKGGVKISSSFVASELRGKPTGVVGELREVRLVGSKKAVQVEVGRQVTVVRGGFVTLFADALGRKKLGVGQKMPLPTSFFIEGQRRSRTADDIRIPLRFFDKAGEQVAQTSLPGSVVQVRASLEVDERTVDFQKLQKMLILGSGAASASVRPDLSPTIRWSYPGRAGRFVRPQQLTSAFTAGRRFTDPGTSPPPEIALSLGYVGGQRIEAASPLLLTAPRSLALDSRSSGRFSVPAPSARGFFSANGGAFSLFEKEVKYVLLDQYGAPISNSVYGGPVPTIKENIHLVLQSRIPGVQQFIRRRLRATRDWRDKPKGKFTDQLRAKNIPIANLRVRRSSGQLVFADELLRTDARGRPIGVLMDVGDASHVWSISVDGREDPAIRVDATANPFTVRVTAISNGRIRFTSDYQVRLQ